MKEFLLELRVRNEMLYYFGAACILMSVVCVLLIKFTSVQVLGTNAFYKPFKFFLSTAIFVWSMNWYGYYLDEPNTIWWYSIALIVFFTIEDVYIFAQAAKGETSHFNLNSTYNQVMWGLMVVCAIGISLCTLVLTFKFFSNPLYALPDYYAWSIRLALVIFVIYSLQGMTMGARMSHSVGGPDGRDGIAVVNWSKSYGDLRIAHFFGMHALQLLPLVSFFVLRNLTWTLVFALIYFVIAAFRFGASFLC